MEKSRFSLVANATRVVKLVSGSCTVKEDRDVQYEKVFLHIRHNQITERRKNKELRDIFLFLQLGVPGLQAPLILSIAAVTEVLSRIAFGILGDVKR